MAARSQRRAPFDYRLLTRAVRRQPTTLTNNQHLTTSNYFRAQLFAW
jgi:hypothetical protein